MSLPCVKGLLVQKLRDSVERNHLLYVMLFAQSLDRNGELLVLCNARLEARAFGKAALEAATTEGQKAREEEKSEIVDVELIALPDSLSHRLLRFIHTLNVCNSFVILCVAIEGLDH